MSAHTGHGDLSPAQSQGQGFAKGNGHLEIRQWRSQEPEQRRGTAVLGCGVGLREASCASGGTCKFCAGSIMVSSQTLDSRGQGQGVPVTQRRRGTAQSSPQPAT